MLYSSSCRESRQLPEVLSVLGRPGQVREGGCTVWGLKAGPKACRCSPTPRPAARVGGGEPQQVRQKGETGRNLGWRRGRGYSCSLPQWEGTPALPALGAGVEYLHFYTQFPEF